MTAAEKRRGAWGYDPDTPLCCNCVGYRRARVEHDDRGAVVAFRPWCTKGRFTVNPNGCCDKWSSKTGERLTP